MFFIFTFTKHWFGMQAGQRLFVVIRFVFQDGERTVKLFGEQKPYHLMGKGHSADGNLVFEPVFDLVRKTVCPSDDEHHVFTA